MEKHVIIRVFGKVQGVYFRQTTLDKALSLNLKGIVLNEADGSVYISARGQEEDLKLFLSYCELGPSSAKVENVFVEECELQEFEGFKILR